MASKESLERTLLILHAHEEKRQARFLVTIVSIVGVAVGLFAGMTTKGNEGSLHREFIQTNVAVLEPTELN